MRMILLDSIIQETDISASVMAPSRSPFPEWISSENSSTV
jgi:hypothetical protein